jgi:hypothetical protein
MYVSYGISLPKLTNGTILPHLNTPSQPTLTLPPLSVTMEIGQGALSRCFRGNWFGVETVAKIVDLTDEEEHDSLSHAIHHEASIYRDLLGPLSRTIVPNSFGLFGDFLNMSILLLEYCSKQLTTAFKDLPVTTQYKYL